MKKFLGFVLALASLFCVGTVATACSPSDAIIVQTNAFFAPFEYYDGTDIVGVDVDIMQKVGEKLGKDVVFQDGDFAMIMGFPGTTERYITSFGLANTMDITNTIRYEVRTDKLAVMREGMEKDQKTRIQYASKYASCANYWKYSNEQNKALRNLNTMGNKQAIEREFAAWVNADPARKAVYGSVLADLQKGYADMKTLETANVYAQEALAGPEAHLFAYRTGRVIAKLCDETVSAEDKAKIREALKEMAGGDHDNRCFRCRAEHEEAGEGFGLPGRQVVL